MESKQKAAEQFINEFAKIEVPSTVPTLMEGIKYSMRLIALAEKVFEAGYSAGLTEKTINDLKK